MILAALLENINNAFKSKIFYKNNSSSTSSLNLVINDNKVYQFEENSRQIKVSFQQNGLNNSTQENSSLNQSLSLDLAVAETHFNSFQIQTQGELVKLDNIIKKDIKWFDNGDNLVVKIFDDYTNIINSPLEDRDLNLLTMKNHFIEYSL